MAIFVAASVLMGLINVLLLGLLRGLVQFLIDRKPPENLERWIPPAWTANVNQVLWAVIIMGIVMLGIQCVGQFIDRYLERYPGIKRFMDECISEGKIQGYAKTLFGRRRYLPELNSPNHNMREFGKRAAMNSPIQGTAADIIKLAMVRVDEALRRESMKSRLILQVHDERIIEAPVDEVERAEALLRREMEGVTELCVPLAADVSSGRNWNECK